MGGFPNPAAVKEIVAAVREARDAEDFFWMPKGASPLERHAWELAREAANFANVNTAGRTPAWRDLAPGQAALATQALTQVSITVAMTRVPMPDLRR